MIFSPYILGRPLRLALRRLWRRTIGHAVAPDTADEMVVPDDETLDHRAGGIIGIGDEVERVAYLQGSQKQYHLVEECPLVPVREHDAFVDPTRKGNGKDAFESPGENRDGLQGMAHNVGGLRIRLRLLMEQFHRGHFPPRFGDLDPVSDQKKSSVHPEDGGVNLEEKRNPRPGENLHILRHCRGRNRESDHNCFPLRPMARTTLVTPRRSDRTVIPAMHVENQRKLLKREQAGLNCATTLHHCIHSSIVPPEIVLDFLP